MPERMDREVKDVLKVWESYREAQATRLDTWRNLLDMYRCIPPVFDDEDIVSNVFVPISFETVELFVPLQTNSLLDSRNPIILAPVTPDDAPFCRVNQALIQYQNEHTDFELQLVLANKDMGILGTAILFHYWGQFDGQWMPLHRNVSLFDFWPDPYAQNINGNDGCRRIFYRRMVSESELLKMAKQKGWKNVDMVIRGVADDAPYDAHPYSVSQNDSDNEPGDSKDAKNHFLLMEWTPERYRVIGNERAFLDEGKPNPYNHKLIPFSKMILSPNSWSFYGTGLLEPVQSLQMEINTKRNQRLDAGNLSTRPYFMGRAGAIKDMDQLENLTCGSYIEVASDYPGPLSDSLQPFIVPDVTRGNFQEEEICRRDFQNVTGITDIVSGKYDMASPATATEAKQKQMQAGQRSYGNFLLCAKTYYKHIVNFRLSMNQQFLKAPMQIRIAGARPEEFQFMWVDPRAYNAQFDVHVNIDPGGAIEERTLMKLGMATQAVLPMVGLAAQTGRMVNPLPLARRAAETLLDDDGQLIDEIFPEPAPMAQPMGPMNGPTAANLPQANAGGQPATAPPAPFNPGGMANAMPAPE